MTFLLSNPPRRSQFRNPRRARPNGVTVLHTAESVMDSVGPDTGAESVARFIQGRTTPGSYHDIVDSDSAVQLVPYGWEAHQDGTGSNPWALSISFALSAADWPRLTPARRDAFLRQGVVAFLRQQQWLRAHGYPMTPLRRITRAQSEAGVPGFIGHGERDPGRRSDPGVQFPWTRFFQLITEAAGASAEPDQPQEDTVFRAIQVVTKGSPLEGAIGLVAPNYFRHVPPGEWAAHVAGGTVNPKPDDVSEAEWNAIRHSALSSEQL